MSINTDETGAVRPLGSLVKFQITKLQYLLATIALGAVLGLGVSSTFQSTAAISQRQILSAIETPAASIIFTQRETLVYATRLAQWSNGGIPRRNVQIARNILAQRLAVIDTGGRSMGERAPAGYLKALKDADAIVASGPIGVLPDSLRLSVSKQASPAIDRVILESRKFVVTYQKFIDQALIDRERKIADRDQLNLTLFFTFLFFGLTFFLLNARLNFANYRKAKLTLETEQIQLDLTIEQLNKAQSTVAELQNLDEAKNAFISTVNHELRTPLTSIMGYIDLIREERLDKKDTEFAGYLKVLERNAEMLLDLVESVLSMSKFDSDHGELSEDRVSLNQIIDNAIFVMKPAVERRQIHISFIVEGEYFVQGNSGQLSQVMLNLIGNAVKFSPEGSKIEIYIDGLVNPPDQEMVQIRVTDHGIGILAEDIEHLFTRFFRGKNAVSQQYPGTGLGLAIVQQIVAKHGGKISLSSVVDEGTTFTVNLPTFVSSENKMIAQRRPDVLNRALTKLVMSTPETFKDVLHEMGGSIGFYDCIPLSEQILEYAHSLEGVPTAQDFDDTKARFILSLTTEIEEVAEANRV